MTHGTSRTDPTTRTAATTDKPARSARRARRVRALAVLSVLLVGGGLLASGPAAAAPSHSDGYPRFANEGKYPERTNCTYSLKYKRSATVGNRTVRLKYYYSGGCGSFARIENAPRKCAVWLDRTGYKPSGTPKHWDWVRETVDQGDDFAYTQVGNNLNGRVSRGALVCDGKVKVRTPWY